MRAYEAKTILALRQQYPSEFAPYLDDKIAQAYSAYCQMFHAASWTDVPLEDFVKWAITRPIDNDWGAK